MSSKRRQADYVLPLILALALARFSVSLCSVLQARILDVLLANGVGDDLAAGLGANPSEVGDGLNLDSGIAERLFQFQLTGAQHQWRVLV